MELNWGVGDGARNDPCPIDLYLLYDTGFCGRDEIMVRNKQFGRLVMSSAFKQVFNAPQGRMTSVVLDKPEFDAMADSLIGVFTQDSRADESHIQRIKDAGHLPLMGRGTKTQFVFDQFDIDTDLAGFIVRGNGRKVLDDAMWRPR